MLWDGHGKCDQVVRTLFKGTVLGVDEGEAVCRDRRSYAFREALINAAMRSFAA
jgi:hypothetical protein